MLPQKRVQELREALEQGFRVTFSYCLGGSSWATHKVARIVQSKRHQETLVHTTDEQVFTVMSSDFTTIHRGA